MSVRPMVLPAVILGVLLSSVFPPAARSDAAETGKKSASSATGGEWPGWLGPNRDGKSTDTGLLKEWPHGGPPLLWKATKIGKGFSGVAVSHGLVYITGEADKSLMIYAYDLQGNLKWETPNGPAYTGDHPGSRATPTIDGNNLYLLSGTGQLGCFDARSGKRRWVKEAKDFGGDRAAGAMPNRYWLMATW